MSRQSNDDAQVRRFLETARALSCDEDKEKFEATLRNVAAQKSRKEKSNDGNKNIRRKTIRSRAKDTD